MRPNLNPLHTSFHPPSSCSSTSHPRPQDQPTISPTTSPTSPTTTASISSPSPPTSPFYVNSLPRSRRLHYTHHHPCAHPIAAHQRGRLPTRDRHPHNSYSHHHPVSGIFPASGSPSPSPNSAAGTTRGGGGGTPSPFRLSASSLFSPRPLSLFLRRRQPSRAEVALTEERWRAEEDRFERLGLEMLEPRPIASSPSSSSPSSSSVSYASALGIGGFDDGMALGLGVGMGMSMDGAVEGSSSEYSSSSSSGSGCACACACGCEYGYVCERAGGPRVVMEGIFEVMEEGEGMI